MKDEIMDQVRSARAQIAQECGYDPNKILEHARQTASRISGFSYVTRDVRKSSVDMPKK